MPTKAPAPAVAPALWWYEGFAEIGYRDYLNDPDRSKLGRFLRYEDFRPGVFGNFFFGAHRTGADPFDITAWGYNVGWDDQAYELNLSQPGTYYLTFGWDETPHVYSRDAKTTFGPIGSDVLTTLPYPYPPGAASQTFVNANSTMFNLGFRRDTAKAGARWTPDDNWDITVDYSHMHRDGTQPGSIVTFTNNAPGGSATRATTQLPKPVDDTTQNASAKAEYAGSSPWGKPFNVALGYGVSLYDDSLNSLTFRNPWATANDTTFPLWNRYSLWPDNQAHSLSLSSGVGLPLNSRYMGTFQYTWMLQDDTFLPSNINPLATLATGLATLPRSSLNGDARTTLSNNVLNTQITSELTSTLRYRYYDYHSNQGPMTITGLVNQPDTSNAATVTETAYPVNFTKQNANAQLDYRPWKWLNLGGAYEWEQWRHKYADATDVVTLQTGAFDAVTNENAVRAFADVKTWGWSTWRTSIRYGERRLDGDYINDIGANSGAAGNAFRGVDLQNRNSTIVKSSWDINVTQTVTFTPNGGYHLDDYQADGVTTLGITKYESWNAGADVTWAITPTAAVYASYMHEDGARDVFQRNLPATLYLATRDLDDVFIVGGKFTAIPDKLFLKASYTYSKGTSKWSSSCAPLGCAFSPMPVYPDTHNTNQRVDAEAKYMLDPTFVRNAGFFADAKPYVKARVVWEKNDNDSWQNVQQQLGWAINPGDATTSRAVFLGMSDPNYDVVVGMLSFGMKW